MIKHGNNDLITENQINYKSNKSNQQGPSAIKVKDAVSVFNAIAAQREK